MRFANRLRQVRAAVGAATINPDLLTAAERLQYEGYLRREDTNVAISALVLTGAVRQIHRTSAVVVAWISVGLSSQPCEDLAKA